MPLMQFSFYSIVMLISFCTLDDDDEDDYSSFEEFHSKMILIAGMKLLLKSEVVRI